MRQPAADDIRGYVLHHAYWCLLQKATEPASLSLERLTSVCESLPFPLGSNGLCWGHEYGEFLRPDIDSAYPWMERFSYRSILAVSVMGAWDDPYDGLIFCTMSPTTVDRPESPLQLDNGTDRFSQLPWELREMIFVPLPTKDALNLRLACRSFLPLFSSVVFWSSRFEPDGERLSLRGERGKKSQGCHGAPSSPSTF